MGNFFYTIFQIMLFAFAVVAAFWILVILANIAVFIFDIAKMLVEHATNRNK